MHKLLYMRSKNAVQMKRDKRLLDGTAGRMQGRKPNQTVCRYWRQKTADDYSFLSTSSAALVMRVPGPNTLATPALYRKS